MRFAPGSRLGAYEILGPLGAGGMGEVWRARDTRLQREVALKILPEAFAQDADRLARFTREAHVLASLNHPNIAAIYSFEEIDGVRFLVLELVTGETLKQRIVRAPVSMDEALRFALQIADALEAAHGKGILHRDLKPANVNVTSEGKVKLLDFGLAKAFALGTASPDISLSPTLDADPTRQGVVLGTASYMSPEQAPCRPRHRPRCATSSSASSRRTPRGAPATCVRRAPSSRPRPALERRPLFPCPDTPGPSRAAEAAARSSPRGSRSSPSGRPSSGCRSASATGRPCPRRRCSLSSRRRTSRAARTGGSSATACRSASA